MGEESSESVSFEASGRRFPSVYLPKSTTRPRDQIETMEVRMMSGQRQKVKWVDHSQGAADAPYTRTLVHWGLYKSPKHTFYL